MGTERAARAASLLFVAAGMLTILSADLPGTRSSAIVRVLGVLSVLVGLLTWSAPWERWPRRATLGLVVPAFILISVGNRYGTSSPYSYAVYFIVLFTWVGLSQPRRTSIWLAPAAAAFYVAPLWHAPDVFPGAAASTLVAIPVCVLVGETVAWAVDELRVARGDADHRATLLRAVAGATTSITALDWDHVLRGVVDAATSLDFEIAALALFDDADDTYRLLHPRGFTGDYVERAHAGSDGLVGLVRERRVTVAADRSTEGGPVATRLAQTGLDAVIASPVWVQGHLAAVLIAGTRCDMRFTAEDVEAFDLLALHAGRALENARRFGDEREAKETLAEASLRDELTGVGNRRHSVRLLDALQVGDAVMIVDVDHFKSVNDRHGHGTGDSVLVELADHLRSNVRDPQLVARYGGDEFVVVLPHIEGSAIGVADRLLAGWRDRGAHATFSAGLAVHEAGEPHSATIAKADAALYAAKRLGRDRVCEHGIFASATAEEIDPRPVTIDVPTVADEWTS
jgi:diguanylate cyclase (GGDEF)-like protein